MKPETRLKKLIERLRGRVEAAARATGPTGPFFSMETGLLILSVCYGGIMRLRARMYEKDLFSIKSLPCRVISIGNLVAGGTGKTPMTILVARRLKELGCRVAVVSRGYRGRMEAGGGTVSDGRTLLVGPDEAGDEPVLMARLLPGVPVVVGRRRYQAGMLAVERFDPEVIVLDDAFQHLGLKRDLNLVLLDRRSPLGNGYILPRGLLREPLSALRRADAIIFTRSDEADLSDHAGFLPAGLEIFHTIHVPVVRYGVGGSVLDEGLDWSSLKDRTAVAFCGLADNTQFFDQLEKNGILLAHRFPFADHHRYETDDLHRIAEAAQTNGADLLVTTFKDFVKVENRHDWPVPVVAVDVAIGLISDEPRFLGMLSRTLESSLRG